MALGKNKSQFSVSLPKEYLLMLDADAHREIRSRGQYSAKIIIDYYDSLTPEEKDKVRKNIEYYLLKNPEKTDDPEIKATVNKAIKTLER